MLPCVSNLFLMVDAESLRAERGTENPRGLLGNHFVSARVVASDPDAAGVVSTKLEVASSKPRRRKFPTAAAARLIDATRVRIKPQDTVTRASVSPNSSSLDVLPPSPDSRSIQMFKVIATPTAAATRHTAMGHQGRGL